jgi:ATP-dependent RNA helicase DHX37/DHR1
MAELMNQSRRLKRIRKGATAAGQAAAEAAVPSKKIKFLAAPSGKADRGNVMDIDEEGDSDDANADIMVKFTKAEQAVRKKAASKAHQAVEKEATEVKMSKRKIKALRKLKDRQERESKREELFASLAKHHVDARAAGLLKSSSTLGTGRETKKQRLSRAIKEERAGLAVTAASDLVVGMESRIVGESARARRKRLQREQEEREMALLASSSDDSEDESDQAGKAEAECGAALGSDEDAALENGKDGPAGQSPREETVSASATTDAGHGKTGSSEPAQRKPAFYVHVKRNPEIQQARSKLPMFAEEQQVMEAIHLHDVIVLCGATGCGKSTQLPQFLYEAGFGHEKGTPGMIGCTQPRRVAAITTAKRIAKELNMPLGKQVGFQVRYEKRMANDTKIKVMTDGILLKEIQSDFLLSDYSVIVVDEAHERGVNSDVLIGLLSRLVPLRRKGMTKDGRMLPPLKLIIMSATLRVTDFTENAPLFPIPPPVIEVSARQHPVTVHFNRRTPLYTYMQEAFKKACKIHRKLPGGGILIFLTGRREIEWMCRNLREELGKMKKQKQKAKARPQLRDGAFSTAGPNAVDMAPTRGCAGAAAAAAATGGEVGETADAESGNKEAFLFGQDDGADSDIEVDMDGEDGADYEDEEDEEVASKGAEALADDDESEEEEDLPEEEYDLSESEEEEGADANPDDESEDEEEKAKRTVMLDGAALARGAAGLTGENTGSASKHAASSGGKQHDAKGGAAKDGARAEKARGKVSKRPNRVLVVPLYSMLPGPQQLKAFHRPPKGVRLVVVATNVAETSITIPGIRYVVDTVHATSAVCPVYHECACTCVYTRYMRL